MVLPMNSGCDHNRDHNNYSRPGAKTELLNYLQHQQSPQAFHQKKLNELESYLTDRIAFFAHPSNMMEVATYILKQDSKNPPEVQPTFGKLVDVHVIESNQSINTQIKTYFDGHKFSFVLSVPDVPATNPHATPGTVDQGPTAARSQTDRKVSWSDEFEHHVRQSYGPHYRERGSVIPHHFTSFVDRLYMTQVRPQKDNIQSEYLEELGWTLTWAYQQYKDRVVIVLS